MGFLLRGILFTNGTNPPKFPPLFLALKIMDLHFGLRENCVFWYFYFCFLEPKKKCLVSERQSQQCLFQLFDRDEGSRDDDPLGK